MTSFAILQAQNMTFAMQNGPDHALENKVRESKIRET